MPIAYCFDCTVGQTNLQQVVVPKHNHYIRFLHYQNSSNQNTEPEQVENSAHNRNLDFGTVCYSFAAHTEFVGFVGKKVDKQAAEQIDMQVAEQVDMQAAELDYDVQDAGFDKSVSAEQFDNKTASP